VGFTSTIYLLHFEPAYVAATPTGRPKKAGHYLGSTAGEVEARLGLHLAGRGSPLVAAAVAAGCQVRLVRTWPGGRTLERAMKRAHHHARFCPICNPAKEE